MNTSKILILILAITIVFLSVKIVLTKNTNANMDSASDSKNRVLENIYTRTSVRTYQERKIEDDKIEQILKAAMSAPSAVNKQPWAFVVVKEEETLDRLGSSLPTAGMLKEAPLAIVVCGDLSKALEGIGAEYWIQDASAATENILLAAHGLGLGAVWTGVYPVKDRILTVKTILKLPDSIIPLNVIPIGYPKGPQAPKDKWNKKNIHYNKW